MKKKILYALCLCLIVPVLSISAPALSADVTEIEEMCDQNIRGNNCEATPYAIITTKSKDGSITEEIVELTIEDIDIETSSTSSCNGITSLGANTTFIFSGLAANEDCRGNIQYYIEDGIGSLYIDSCMWAPQSNTLYFGLYNIATSKAYTIPRTGGDLDDMTVSYLVPVGTYTMYAKNASTPTLTVGSMFYTLD